MKTFTIVISFFCIWIFAQNPCEDTRYTELQSIELDSMSQRQYEYFMLKEKECQKYNENKECIISLKMECSFDVPGVPQPSRKVFIDDVFVGDMPLNVKVSEGVHTISLYSNKFLNIDKAETDIDVQVNTTISNNVKYVDWSDNGDNYARKQGIKSILKVKMNKGEEKSILYKVKCDEGITRGKCDNNNWYYDISFVK